MTVVEQICEGGAERRHTMITEALVDAFDELMRAKPAAFRCRFG